MDFTNLTLSDVILIIGCIIIVATAIRIFTVGLRSLTNRFFSISLFFLALYVFSNFMIDFVRTPVGSLFWVRVSGIAIILFSSSFFLFSRSFGETKNRSAIRRRIVVTYVISALLVIFSTTQYAIHGVNIEVYPVAVVRGNYYYGIVVSVLVFIVLSAFGLFRSYKVAYRIEKYQLKYILSGLFIILGIVLITNIILPYLGQNEYSRIGPSFLVILALMGGYALISTNLSDLNIVLLRGSFFVSTVMLYITIFSIVFQFLSQRYGSIYSTNSIIILLIEGSISLYSLGIIKNLEDKILVSLDRSRRLDIYNKVNQIFIKYRPVRETNALLERILSFGFQAKWVRVSLKESPNFFDFKSTQILSYDQITLKNLRGYHLSEWETSTKIELKKIGASLVVPLTLDGETFGNIIFGEKVISSPYTLNEILFLQSLADSIVVGLKKVLLYDEVQTFNQTLQKKIDDATKTLQEQKSQLQEKYQFEKDMMGIMGHELRTPMTIARGMSELLVQKADTGQEIAKDYLKEKLEKISDSIVRESDLIQTMLSTSHIDNRRVNFQVTKFDLIELIDYAVFSFKKDAETKGLKLEFIRPDFDIPQLSSDQNRVQEIINNLISNAIKYTNEGSVIISLEKYGDMINLIVKDTGIGIPAEEIQNIGRKFYRIHQHLDEKKDVVRAGGTGLGLYVVKGLLEAMGGELKVDSSEGKGSTFTAVIPVELKESSKSLLSNREVDENDLFQKLGFAAANQN